jgi:hypothetical protein
MAAPGAIVALPSMEATAEAERKTGAKRAALRKTDAAEAGGKMRAKTAKVTKAKGDKLTSGPAERRGRLPAGDKTKRTKRKKTGPKA